MRRSARPWLLSVVLLLSGCSCDDGSSDDRFDGNLLVGDGASDSGVDAAQPFDGSDDASASDADDAGSDEDGGDDAGPASDAEPVDGGELDAGEACNEPSLRSFPAREAAQWLATLEGQIVTVTGTAAEAGLSCTDRACPLSNPCCNTCSAQIQLDGRVRLLTSSCIGFTPGCEGSECGRVCRPSLLGLPQRFRGRLTREGTAPALSLFEVLP